MEYTETVRIHLNEEQMEEAILEWLRNELPEVELEDSHNVYYHGEVQCMDNITIEVVDHRVRS